VVHKGKSAFSTETAMQAQAKSRDSDRITLNNQNDYSLALNNILFH
jgi:hypothetical protein